MRVMWEYQGEHNIHCLMGIGRSMGSCSRSSTEFCKCVCCVSHRVYFWKKSFTLTCFQHVWISLKFVLRIPTYILCIWGNKYYVYFINIITKNMVSFGDKSERCKIILSLFVTNTSSPYNNNLKNNDNNNLSLNH